MKILANDGISTSGENVLANKKISGIEKITLWFFDGKKLVFEIKSVKFEKFLVYSGFLSIIIH